MSAGRLAVLALWLVFGGYCAYVGWAHVQGHRAAARGETPLFTDFTPTYAGSLLLRGHPPEDLYRPRKLYELELEAARAAYGYRISDAQAQVVGYAPWMYPPSFLLFVFPLAYMPYLIALGAWLVVTALPYLEAMRRILGGSLGIPAALAAPPAFFNLMYGQTGFLSAGLIALGLLGLRSRPLLAGVLIGLASVKPHFGLLIPFALAAGGHWRVFGSAFATVLGLIALSVLAFGDDPWFGFLGTLEFHMQGYRAGAYAWHVMTTLLSALKLSGLALESAWTVQYALSICVAALVIWPWWRYRHDPGRDGLLCALLCVGTMLAVPFAYVYDLVLLVPAAAWLWADLQARGGGTWDKLQVLAAVSASLLLRVLPAATGISLVVAGELLLFGLILQRLWLKDANAPAVAGENSAGRRARA